MTEPAGDGYDRKTIFVSNGRKGEAAIGRQAGEGWEQLSKVRATPEKWRVELRRPIGFIGQAPPAGPPRKSGNSLAGGIVVAVVVVGLLVWGGISFFSGKDDTAAPAAMSDTDYDRGRCQQMASDFEKYRQEKLIPIVNAGASAVGPGSFRAISGDTQTVIDTMGKWSTGMRDTALAAKFTTAISTGRTFLAVAAGSESTNTVASSAAKWVHDANEAFTACPK